MDQKCSVELDCRLFDFPTSRGDLEGTSTCNDFPDRRRAKRAQTAIFWGPSQKTDKIISFPHHRPSSSDVRHLLASSRDAAFLR